MKLEEQLSVAEANLAAAIKFQKQAEKAISAELRVAQQGEREARKARTDAEKAEARARVETKRRLGMTPATLRRAVLEWAGVREEERRHVAVRGDYLYFERAMETIEYAVLDADDAVKAAVRASKAAAQAWSAAYERVSAIDDTCRPQRAVASQAAFRVSEIKEKLRNRNQKPKPEPSEFISAEDRQRFVTARQRIEAAGTTRGKRTIDPPFAWTKGRRA